jgi:hypothetical protein
MGMQVNNAERFRQLKALLDSVVADINECKAYYKKSDSQFCRRMMCRTIFSSIEAIVNHMKQTALLLESDRRNVFSDAERLALRDVEYFIEDNGEVKERSARIRFKANLCFALSALAKVNRPSFVLKKDDGWNALCKSLEVRDRITHPKNADSYLITDDEMEAIGDGWDWFGAAITNVSKSDAE